MIIGIDVGGTHTDGVLLDQNQVVKTSKVLTHRDKLTDSILSSLDELLIGQDVTLIKRIIFSTTLTTNLLAQKRYPPTGLVLIPGPGMPCDWLLMGAKNWIISGSIDHRGRLVKELENTELHQLVKELASSNIHDLAIVSKFSTRNPILEEQVASYIQNHLPAVTNIQLGHRVATNLNFPRRVQTTWLNTAVHCEYANFLQSVEIAVRKRGIQAQLYLLKADGGTMPLNDGLHHGVETIKSGPAASIMGFLALANNENRTALLVDIGGSTTDLALLTNGTPLFEPDGVQVEDYTTSVRGLLSRSIPYGGDSPIILNNGQVSLATIRQGPALAFGGSTPTLTDALALTGLMKSGNLTHVIKGFFNRVETNSKQDSTSPTDLQIEIAHLAIEEFYKLVQKAVSELLQELNNRPVYTIHELLSETVLQPEVLMAVGGPAESLLSGLAERLKLIPFLPKYHHVANALGAAIARLTLRHTLYADTAQHFYTISGLPGKQRISGRFNLSDARHTLWEYTRKLTLEMTGTADNADLTEITHEECFNIVRGFSTQGQIFKLEAQVKPGIDPDLNNLRKE